MQRSVRCHRCKGYRFNQGEGDVNEKTILHVRFALDLVPPRRLPFFFGSISLESIIVAKMFIQSVSGSMTIETRDHDMN